MSSEHPSQETSSQPDPPTGSDRPLIYQIRVRSHLGSDWTDWFEGLAITLDENGDTLLTGPVVDQAALHGLLKKVRDLGISLVSINPVERNKLDMARNEENIG